MPDEVLGLLADLRDLLQNKMEPPVYVSDRRLVKAIALLKVWDRPVCCVHPHVLASCTIVPDQKCRETRDQPMAVRHAALRQ